MGKIDKFLFAIFFIIAGMYLGFYIKDKLFKKKKKEYEKRIDKLSTDVEILKANMIDNFFNYEKLDNGEFVTFGPKPNTKKYIAFNWVQLQLLFLSIGVDARLSKENGMDLYIIQNYKE